jgi:hypothetical protein
MTLSRAHKDGQEPGANVGFTVECKIHFKDGRRGRKRIRQGEAPAPVPIEPGNVPRVSRLMALAIRFDSLIQQRAVQDYADIARLGHVSRARVTQIMNLLLLAPDIQEDILFLPRTIRGRDPITERDLRPITAVVDWAKQRRIWQETKDHTNRV